MTWCRAVLAILIVLAWGVLFPWWAPNSGWLSAGLYASGFAALVVVLWWDELTGDLDGHEK